MNSLLVNSSVTLLILVLSGCETADSETDNGEVFQ